MLYHVFQYLEQNSNIPGAGLFAFISFRAGMAIIVSLLISVVFGGSIVNYLRRKQVGETVRDLGLEGQMSKQGTPTMGGIMILASILIPTLLFADLTNIYILLMLLVTVFMGMIGFLDDYIKVFRKNKEGLRGRFKILGQVILGLIVGLVIMFHPDVQIRDFNKYYVYEMDMEGERFGDPIQVLKADSTLFGGSQVVDGFIYSHDVRSTKTTIPLIKNNEFNYESLVKWLPEGTQKWVFPILFIGIMIFIITAVSNGANLTDGLDGLATGTSAVIVFTLLLFAYVSGNSILADYLNIMYIPRSGELVVFSAAFVGACVGFLWWNAYPAQVFMGDTGSLAIGGIIATLAIAIRKELLIPILCGVFLAEVVSVIIQTQWFKYTRIKFGEGRRIFKMAPLHHHYQKLGFPETKIVIRFWIVGILLAIISIVTLKIR